MEVYGVAEGAPFCAEPVIHVFDHVISLGDSCQNAYQLQRLGLRCASYPFDWLFSEDVEQVILALENDFADWLLLENLREDPDSPTPHRRVIDSKYGTIHQHIFPKDVPIAESYPEVRKTVDRRVKRFLELKSGGQHNLFIRSNITPPPRAGSWVTFCAASMAAMRFCWS